MNTQEGFKRPDHPDFMTTGELKKIEFTGVRACSISGDTQFWILGNIEGVVTSFQRMLDPQAVMKKHLEIFAMKPNDGE